MRPRLVTKIFASHWAACECRSLELLHQAEIDLALCDGQIIEINKTSLLYNGQGDDGEGGFVHYFTFQTLGKETTFAVLEISLLILSQAVEDLMDRYARFGQEAA
jgi:hypothetical protein